jgi:hypothetical protein
MFAPRFAEKDVLFVWENTKEETRLREDIKTVTGHTGKLPTKLTNKWSGPYPFVRMVGERHAVVKKDGKEVQYNVNRLWNHQQWDEWHPDTGLTWKEEVKNQKEVMAERSAEEDSKSKQGTRRTLQEGEVIVFAKEMSENDPLPFGIGRVIGTESTEGQGIRFQWLGNTTFNPRGTFLPGWLDPVDRKFYFQHTPNSQENTKECRWQGKR